MRSKKATVKTSFHILPARLFTKKAASFESEIRVIWEERNIISDGKSILGLMALGIKEGTVLTITAEGPDEDRAVEELADLAENGL